MIVRMHNDIYNDIVKHTITQDSLVSCSAAPTNSIYTFIYAYISSQSSPQTLKSIQLRTRVMMFLDVSSIRFN